MNFIKKLLLATAIVLGVVASGFAQEQEEVITESGAVETVEKEPLFYINETLRPFVETYFASMLADGWNLSSLRDSDLVVLFDYEVGQSFENKAGIALGMFDDDKVYVVISAQAWITLEDYGRQDLINHELMHDIFNVEHTEVEDERKLMHPSSYPGSWADTFYRLIDAINDLNTQAGH